MPNVYFGYGSNLWKNQMKIRCPTSEYLGIARLKNFKWIINARGYANVVESLQAGSDEVWGLVYSLQPSDEARLDVNEGVPEAYTKEYMKVDFWPVGSDSKPNVKNEPSKMTMLVYIDRLRTEPDKPRAEYIYRMNMGIEDALREGVPRQYVDEVLRKFIRDVDVEDREARELAKKQAEKFEDSREEGSLR